MKSVIIDSVSLSYGRVGEVTPLCWQTLRNPKSRDKKSKRMKLIKTKGKDKVIRYALLLCRYCCESCLLSVSTKEAGEKVKYEMSS